MRPPSVLVPYPGPTTSPAEQDIAIYLRPESNGVLVESAMLGALRQSSHFHRQVSLVYLANIPGSFMAHREVVHQHYATRVHFARIGGRAFTDAMRRRFEQAFGIPFAGAPVLGAFEAMGRLGVGADELFELRVPPAHHAVIQGQSVKRWGEHFVVNYDIPALLAKHDEHTDVFSMLLRSRAGYGEFIELVAAMERALRDRNIVAETTPISHVFHYSKGPVEQILDGLGYLYRADGSRVPATELSFTRYLLDAGLTTERILTIVRHPIVRIASADGKVEEVEILEHTRGDSYAAATAKVKAVVEVVELPYQTGEPL